MKCHTLTSLLTLVLAAPLLGQPPYTKSAAAAVATTQIWIACRTDGDTGTGAENDPYDGSTIEKLGAVFADAPTHCIINVGPGIYQIADGTVALKDYQRLIGAGEDATTFSMQGVVPGAAGAGYCICISSPFANSSSIDVADLTCNGNASLYAPYATAGNTFMVAGINLIGDRIVISRCRMTNMGGNKQEAFPIALSVIGANNPCHFLVKDCSIDNTYFSTLGATAIIFARSSETGGVPMNGDMSSSGQIDHCYVYNGGNFGCAGFFNMTVSDCYSDNRGTTYWGGWNSDTCANQNITIVNNTFYTNGFQYRSSGAINVGGAGPFTNYQIINNHFYIGTNGYLTSAVSFQANVVNSQISGNTIDPLPGTSVSGNQRPLFINGSGNARFALTNNISDMDYAPTDSAVCGLAVTNGGTGYTMAPTGTVSGGGGSGATVVAYLSADSVGIVLVTNGGAGYTSAPTITWSGGGGAGVTMQALNVVNGSVTGNYFTTVIGNKHKDGTPTLNPPQSSN